MPHHIGVRVDNPVADRSSHSPSHTVVQNTVCPSMYFSTGMPPHIQRGVRGVVDGHTVGLIRNTFLLRIVQRVKSLVQPGT